MTIDRRSLLCHSLHGAALAAISPALARAAAIGPDRRSGGLGDIDHIVVLMQENRSFDHYFGTMAGGGYDLFVLGPAGFHRLFVGDGRAEPEVAWRITDTGPAGKALRINAKPAHGLRVVPGAYHSKHTDWTPDAAGTHTWPLAPTHGWYDLIVTAPGGWQRRLAGCVAGPWRAISDPALA